MYRTILVPLDGSKLAERALPVAAQLAEQHGARLLLLTAHAPVLPLALGGGAPVTDAALNESLRDEQRAYLEKVARRLRKQTTLTVDSLHREGPIVRTIAEQAVAEDAGLIVMCTHGRGGFQRFWLGSVSDGVLRHASMPVLLLRSGRSPGKRLPGTPLFSRVLVPLDGSDRAERAIAAARELLGTAPARLTLAHLVHPMMAAAAAKSARDPQAEVAATYLSPLARETETPTIEVTWETGVDVNVARALLALAEETNADLIAIAGQGHGGVKRVVIGSVADKLIRTAEAPVLVVPATE